MSESSDYPKRPVLIDIESGFSLSAGRFKVTNGNVSSLGLVFYKPSQIAKLFAHHRRTGFGAA